MSLEVVKQSPPPPWTSQTAVDKDRGRAEADIEQSKERQEGLVELWHHRNNGQIFPRNGASLARILVSLPHHYPQLHQGLEQTSLIRVSSFKLVPLSRLTSFDCTIASVSASAILHHFLTLLPRTAQCRLRPYQLVLYLGSTDHAIDSVTPPPRDY
ncbi:hypothetical protein NL676_029344 [Syzygium grande]|nr:hypothetical protein NL676_029344 [Syzygium grande]